MAVFISYSHQDTPIVDRLARDLLKRNVKVWRDVWRNAPGDDFPSRIEAALAESTAACFFVSRAALESDWVRRELDFAHARASRDPEFVLVPVLLDDSDLPLALRNYLAVDCRLAPEDGLRKMLTVLDAAERKPPKGRISLEDRYFTHFGIEDEQTEGRHRVVLDVVSFDLEETYSVLSQFEFLVNGKEPWNELGLSGPGEIKAHLLRTCAEEFAQSPAVVKVTAQEPKRARFTMTDTSGGVLAQASVRITTLGDGPRGTLVFNYGAVIEQVCRAFGFLPPESSGLNDKT